MIAQADVVPDEWARRVHADLSSCSPRLRGRWLPSGVLGYIPVPERDRGRTWLPGQAWTADRGKAGRVAAGMGGFVVVALTIEASS